MPIPSTGEILKKGEEVVADMGSAAMDSVGKLYGKSGGILLKNKAKMNLPSAGAGNPDLYDVVNDYPWTLTPSRNRINVPYVELEEFEINVTALWQQLKYWLNGAYYSSDNAINPYEGLYHAERTGCKFIFPYFEGYDHLIQPSWEKFKSPTESGGITQAIIGTIAAIGQLAGVAPGSIINQPQVFKGSSPASYPINFTLYNTTGVIVRDKKGNIVDDKIIKKNMDFKRRLQMSTLHSQRSRLFISPPAIFAVTIPGIRYSPAAIISNLEVSNIGQMNSLTTIHGDGKPENVPDAYDFKMVITELITESRELLNDEYTTGNSGQAKIRAIITTPESEDFKQRENVKIPEKTKSAGTK